MLFRPRVGRGGWSGWWRGLGRNCSCGIGLWSLLGVVVVFSVCLCFRHGDGGGLTDGDVGICEVYRDHGAAW